MQRSFTFAVMLLLLALVGVAEPGLALAFAPAVLLLALLTAGVRPGERFILRSRPAPVLKRVRAVSAPRPRLALVVRPVGRAFATALAMRPPPAPRHSTL